MKIQRYVDYEETHLRDMITEYSFWTMYQINPHSQPPGKFEYLPYLLQTNSDGPNGEMEYPKFYEVKEEYLMIAEDGIFENKTQTPLIDNLYVVMQDLINKHRQRNQEEINKL